MSSKQLADHMACHPLPSLSPNPQAEWTFKGIEHPTIPPARLLPLPASGIAHRSPSPLAVPPTNLASPFFGRHSDF